MSQHGMIRSRQGSFAAGYRLIDLTIILASLTVAAGLYGITLNSMYLSAVLIAAVTFYLMAESFGIYGSWRAVSATRMLIAAAGSWVAACLLLVLIGFFAKVGESFSRVVMGSWMLATLFILCGWRLGFRKVLQIMRLRGHNSRRAAIVGLNENAMRLRSQLNDHPELGIRFDGFFDDRSHERFSEDYPEEKLEGTIQALLDRTKSGEYDLIFIALPLKAQKRIAQILERCGDTTANVHLIPDFFTYNLINARLGAVGNVQTISIYDTPIFGFNDVLKRLFDIVFSFSVLALIAIPMLMIAAAVKFTSRGPVIFKQYRYGLDGRKIHVWKFRSMTVMDNGDTVVQAKKGDARITAVGAFIRKTSLDELPQFINVLQGSMSVVGPRPHAVAHNEEYRKLIPYYMLRHKVKPGITGWAQINGYRGETDTLDKMEGRVDYDLDYIRNWSLWMDIKIVFMTVFKGFTGSNVH